MATPLAKLRAWLHQFTMPPTHPDEVLEIIRATPGISGGEIGKELARRHGKGMMPAFATLYTVMSRLERQGRIVKEPPRDEVPAQTRYRIQG